MVHNEIHLELLLGRRVVDAEGRHAGRLEEMRAELRADEWVITEFLVGRAALVERLSAWKIGMSLLRLLGSRKGAAAGYRVPWDKLDLSDPARPRLSCLCDELEIFQRAGRARKSKMEIKHGGE